MTCDMISKIATGVNWRHISKNYNIPRHRRCCMNSYSDNKIPIAIMMNRGYTINMIANKLNIDVKNPTDRNRLYKAAIRYKNYIEMASLGYTQNNQQMPY